MNHEHSIKAGTATILRGTTCSVTTETLTGFCRCGAFLESTRRAGEDWAELHAVLDEPQSD